MFNFDIDLDFDISTDDLIDTGIVAGNAIIDSMLGSSPSWMNNPILSINGSMLPMKNCRVDPSFEIKEADVSGQTSSTAKAKQGNKGATLNVSGIVPFSDPSTLSRIYKLAKATSLDGSSPIYTIGCDTAKVLGIRRVSFTGRVGATEMQGLRAWQVTFTLREHMSPNEMIEIQSIQDKITSELIDQFVPAGLIDVAENFSSDTLVDELQKQIKEQLK